MPDLAEDVSRVGCMLPHYRPWMTNWTRKEKARDCLCPNRAHEESKRFTALRNQSISLR
jgi:hypothetical protein